MLEIRYLYCKGQRYIHFNLHQICKKGKNKKQKKTVGKVVLMKKVKEIRPGKVSLFIKKTKDVFFEIEFKILVKKKEFRKLNKHNLRWR